MTTMLCTRTMRNPWQQNKLFHQGQPVQINARDVVSEMSEVRRCLNTSRRLDWEEYVVPHRNEYMTRMKRAGYHENYRSDTLVNALNVYDMKVARCEASGEPFNRGRNYKVIKGKAEEEKKLEQVIIERSL